MRILFAVTHLGFLRNFESTLALLAERGHLVHLVTDRRAQKGVVTDGTPILERLSARFPQSFSTETVPAATRDASYEISTAIRETLNYWRYLAPAFHGAASLRARARKQAPVLAARLTDLPVAGSRAGVAALSAWLRVLERALPVRPEVHSVFERWKPDLLLVTPLLYFGSRQVDYVRAAQRAGVPSVLGVGSWDHLTTKGLIHELPDRIVVWNELQRTEAAELHGARPEQVAVTGAQAYDHWFATRPSTASDAFCVRVGLPVDRPYLLYLCSSPFIAPQEVDVVRRWIQSVRGSDDSTLRTAGILVRPHPQNAAQWAEVDVSAFGAAAIWPRAGANPVGPEARAEYYDSMYHAHAVVGVNTSALIESGIVGRPVFSFHVPELAGTQEGTLHFRHLRRGGLLRLAGTLDEHRSQLEASFASADADRQKVREFVRLFVRPHGLDQPATPLVVQAIEEQGATRVARRQPGPGRRAMELGLRGLMAMRTLARGDVRSKRDREGVA
jgi:hypothetical protein